MSFVLVDVTEETLGVVYTNMKKIINDIIENEKIKPVDIQISNGCSKGENYLASTYRATVCGFKNGKKCELKLFIKVILNELRELHPIEGMYKRELFSYTNILPTLHKLQEIYDIPLKYRLNYIKCYKGDLTKMSELIVFEDMAEQGFKMGDRRTGLNFEEASLCIRKLSAFHATSFALREYDRERFDEFTKITIDINKFIELNKPHYTASVDIAIEALDNEESKKKLIEFTAKWDENIHEYFSNEKNLPYMLLCHGDCWVNNVMFKYKGDRPVEACIIDWQMIAYGIPILDLSYFLFNSMDEVLRGKYYFKFLNIYHETLVENLLLFKLNVDVCYPRHVFEEHTKKIMSFGLMTSIIMSPIILSESGDMSVNSMADFINKIANKEHVTLKNDSKIRYEKRIRGVVNDCIKFNII